MAATVKVLLLVVFLVINQSFSANISTIELAYNKGVEAYSGQRWSECIRQFKDALDLYRLYKNVLLNCRISCHASRSESEIAHDIEGLQFYEKLFKIKNCLLKCQDQGFSHISMSGDIDETIDSYMQLRKPYEYLHMCFFQMRNMPKAASAAFTFLAVNPDDETMKKNLAYYIRQPEVDKDYIVDLETDDYKVAFQYGTKTYHEAKWKETTIAMERVLTDYIASENKCRAECERQPEQEWSPEIIVTLSNNIAALIQCRQMCQHRLKLLDFYSGVAFLAEVLNYLQISYYHINKIDSAAEVVASYLELIANDEDMLENKKIYSTLTDPNKFDPRSEVVYYSLRDKYEKHILNIFYEGIDTVSTVSNEL